MNYSAATPLTSNQLQLWAGQKLRPEAPLYNMIFRFDLAGAIDVKVFQAAFQELVAKSDNLRTVFEQEQMAVVQRALPFRSYNLPYLDFSASENPESDLLNWIEERKGIQFDLTKQLFDSALIQCGANQFVWYLNIHHLITDALSVTILYGQLGKIYAASLRGAAQFDPVLPPYRDYLDFERQSRERVSEGKIGAYWRERVAAAPGPIRLYGRQVNEETTRSTRIRIPLGPERSRRIRELAAQKTFRSWTPHLSVFNVFATVFFAYLHRVSGEQHLSIGTPAHNRTTPTFRETPGVFVELFPLIVELDDLATFQDLLLQVRTESNNFLRHAVPGAVTPGISRSYQVVLNYITAHFPDLADVPVQTSWIHPDHIDAQHLLRLQVYDFDGNGPIDLGFDTNHAIFDEALSAVAPDHLLRLLDAFLDDPQQSIAAVELLSRSERVQLNEWGTPALPFSTVAETAVDWWQDQVTQSPQATAVIDQEQTWSYTALNQRANQLAHWMQTQRIQLGDRVGLHLRRSADYLVGVWACLKLGAVFVPIPSDYPRERIRFITEDAGLTLILAQSELLSGLRQAPSNVLVFQLDTDTAKLEGYSVQNLPGIAPSADDLAYLLYTSGSTGQPKGVMIRHRSLSAYLRAAATHYLLVEQPVFPLFSSIGFDLTITSTFLPLMNGGAIRIYREPLVGPDLRVLDVFRDDRVDVVKLTPAHLRLIATESVTTKRIQALIVGGEDFRVELARKAQEIIGPTALIFNEYGPTEATVGCIVHQFDSAMDTDRSVPIGRTFGPTQAYVLNEELRNVPIGVEGDLYLAGRSLAKGYWNRPELTEGSFLETAKGRLYRTGDRVRWNALGQLDYLGRTDQQLKIGGRRVELGELEVALAGHAAVEAAVALQVQPTAIRHEADQHCIRCGLPNTFPTAEIDAEGVCTYCRSFEHYKGEAQRYFQNMDDLRAYFSPDKLPAKREYDCLVLLSGGKDSTYALAQMVELGLHVLAFTLDNGYISEEAKDNVRRVVTTLGVDHVFGTTPAMNAIFVDSLHRHKNVCDGCFKTIYTLSIQIALEKKIPYIVTGLSRGQFFETRLTEELFTSNQLKLADIDRIVLDARKAYHRADDAVRRLMDVSMFDQDDVFERVQFLDFYRFSDASLDEMLEYLKEKLPWVRPSDTGRSTNCLINAAGIYVHKKERGYSNYAYPYSWDVRLGHKTRDAALDEINEPIDEADVQRMLREIGYLPDSVGTENQLYLYYQPNKPVSEAALRQYLTERLPPYLLPAKLIPIEEWPLTKNGKLDRRALAQLEVPTSSTDEEVTYEAPRNEIEAELAQLWREVLVLEQVGVHDNFLHLGGNSLAAIRLITRINETFELQLKVNRIFELPTVAQLATHIEETILALLEE